MSKGRGSPTPVGAYNGDVPDPYAFSKIRHVATTFDMMAFAVGLHESETGYEILERACNSFPKRDDEDAQVAPDPRVLELQAVVKGLKKGLKELREECEEAKNDVDELENELVLAEYRKDELFDNIDEAKEKNVELSEAFKSSKEEASKLHKEHKVVLDELEILKEKVKGQKKVRKQKGWWPPPWWNEDEV